MAKKSPTEKYLKPRKFTRFRPDPLTVAYLSLASSSNFEPELAAVVINEAYAGCSILLNSDETFKKDQKVQIKVGPLAVMKGKIVWIKNLEESIYKIGIKFND